MLDDEELLVGELVELLDVLLLYVSVTELELVELLDELELLGELLDELELLVE